MKKILNSTPKSDGFRMPAENDVHKGSWMMWPERTDNWRGGAKPAQVVYANIANTIIKYEPLTMIVSAKQFNNAKSMLDEKIRLVEMSNDDAWVRDCGATYIKNDKGDIRAIDWMFNAWGGLEGGLYFPWDNDDQIARKMAEISGVDYYRADFVLEGGSIHVDGEGTLYTTEECLLNSNRNPHLTKEEIEDNMKEYLGLEKIIWLPLGVYNDETNGHIDNMIQIVKPGHVVLTWTDDKEDPQYAISLKALKILENETDARGRKIKVTKLLQPKPMHYTEEDVYGVDTTSDGMVRESGERLAGSYANFYLVNGAVLLPIFGNINDQNAIDVITKLYPDRKVEPILAREILLGGGNIHCITQQEIQ
ncbi:agmatine deiminase [[Acholeplasma] multilocale]|uniref:agmatine deiminase n=1 Tax=[Acholeplasma] multilocale TaxID=264638 RepID=UPI000478DCC7|nr:agmatine deiminase [[Acholeplasma] multilocale]